MFSLTQILNSIDNVAKESLQEEPKRSATSIRSKRRGNEALNVAEDEDEDIGEDDALDDIEGNTDLGVKLITEDFTNPPLDLDHVSHDYLCCGVAVVVIFKLKMLINASYFTLIYYSHIPLYFLCFRKAM
jgi:hypothetical protein